MSGRTTPVSAAAHWPAPGLLAVAAVLTVAALAGFARAILIAPLHVVLDPNEGWNAYHAASAIARGTPYPPTGSFLTNNYPPLSFYVVGTLGSWLGDNVLAGRLVSLVAFALVCALVVVALRRLGTAIPSVAFAAAFFASTLLLTSDYVGMDDPQLLGHALQLGALVLLLGRRRSSAVVIASAALFVAGGFVKHNLFALPLAALAWLVVTDRRSGMTLAVVLGGLSLVGIIIVQATLGVNLLHELQSPRSFSFDQLKASARDWIAIAGLPLCSPLWLLTSRTWKGQAVWLLSLYAGISVISGIVLLGGAGVDVNAMFDADIALALCTGVAISRLSRADRPIPRAAGQLVAGLCVVPLAVTVLRSTDWRTASYWVYPMREEAALAKQDVSFLRAHAGPAMCEDLTFCYWAGKTASVDVFNLEQQFEAGARPTAPFLHLLQEGAFTSVELDATVPFPFSRDVQSVFLQKYRVDHSDDDGIFFVPK